MGKLCRIGREGGSLGAYGASPASVGPGIVLLQEIFGLNAFVRTTADALAERGFHVLAPDLFERQRSGMVLDPERSDHRAQAMELLEGLEEAAALEDMAAAAEALRADERCNGRIAVLGYCLGGRLAYLACEHSPVDAAVSYYGIGLQNRLDVAARLTMPVLLHVAGEDHLCPADAQSQLAAAATDNPLLTVELHPGVGHAFARRGGGEHRPEAAARADAMTMRFLSQALGL